MTEAPTITIRIYPTEQGGYMYDVYESDAVDEDIEDSDDGGQCTGTYANALEMANDAALKIIRNHFSDNAFNPEICPSSLDENSEPAIDNGDGTYETAHKYGELFTNALGEKVRECDECGAIDELDV